MTGSATKLSYVITSLAGDWIAGYRRPAGPTIDLLPIEAEYDLLAGTLAPPGTPVSVPPPAPAVAPTDQIALLRYGVPMEALLSDLIAFLQDGTVGTKLGIANRLAEIAQAGAAAQAEARNNLGLGRVANTAPADLPVSTAVAKGLADLAQKLDAARSVPGRWTFSSKTGSLASGQTVFPIPGGYTPGFVSVWIGGLQIYGFTATDGATVVITGYTFGANDVVTIETLKAGVVANAATRAEVDALTDRITALADRLTVLDPAASNFEAAFSRLFTAWVAGLPVYAGTGPAPVPAGRPFLNNGTPQIAL